MDLSEAIYIQRENKTEYEIQTKYQSKYAYTKANTNQLPKQIQIQEHIYCGNKKRKKTSSIHVVSNPVKQARKPQRKASSKLR